MIDKLKLISSFKPKGDQPQAIDKLIKGFKNNLKNQVLLGVTGSGKTYTIAKIIEKTQLPTLIISHNKTLAAQLYQEMKEFFPHSPVSYFVSYYDYYQPEAYLPASDTYIAKEVNINPLIDQLRLKATSNIFSYEKSIVIASVSCIYNIGAPEVYQEKTLILKAGDKLTIFEVLGKLADLYYKKAITDFLPGSFRVRGNRLDVFLAYTATTLVRLFFGSRGVEKIEIKELGDKKTKKVDIFSIFAAKHYLLDTNNLNPIFKDIRKELKSQIKYFEAKNQLIEAQRIEKKVNFDLQMIKETGYVNGIENYSRYFDGRKPGQAPYSLLDYFHYQYKKDFLTVIDESHVTIPQIRGMYYGDQARKKNLIDFGFRLPSALDNRPLRFEEFLERTKKTIYVSATPADWEIKKSKNRVIQQVIRPTGLIDPKITVLPEDNLIEDLIKQIKKRKQKKQRTLVITLTKRMAEDLASFLSDPQKTKDNFKVAYLHAD
ncbi:excinuclease ABC subunit B, partial [Candidatus Beckwithbacteria bacterium CG10_big_fil_rev_8_21_14_0_10_34_10]